MPEVGNTEKYNVTVPEQHLHGAVTITTRHLNVAGTTERLPHGVKAASVLGDALISPFN